MKTKKLVIGIFALAVTLCVPGPLFAQKMKIGYWTSGFSLGFGAVMEQMKFAEKEGLNVEWVKFAEVNGPTRAIVSNAIGSERCQPAALASIADLIGSVDRLPADLSAQKKRYLRSTGYGRKRPR